MIRLLAFVATMLIAAPAFAQEGWLQIPGAVGAEAAYVRYETGSDPPAAWVREMYSAERTGRDPQTGVTTSYWQMRIRVIADCSNATQAFARVELLDRSGAVVHSTETGERRWVPLEFSPGGIAHDTMCNPADAPAAVSAAPTLATTTEVVAAFRSEDMTRRNEAAELVRAHPSAFLPIVFVHLGNFLAERGETAEALRWHAFGHVRFLTDIRAASASESDFGSFSVMAPAYSFNTGEALSVAVERESARATRQRLSQALAADATVPRDYPVDWVRWWRAQDIAWGDLATARPGTDLAARRRLAGARTRVSQRLSTPTEP